MPFLLFLNSWYKFILFQNSNISGSLTGKLAFIEKAGVEPGAYQLNIWHPQLQTQNNRMQQLVELHENQQITVQLAQPLAALPEQSGEDDFEFLEEY